MTGGAEAARRFIDAASMVVFDFDGPVCAVYSGRGAADLAATLLSILDPAPDEGQAITRSHDPLDVLRWTAQHRPHSLAAVEHVLDQGEELSVASAEPTPGSHDLIRRLSAHGKVVAVASNNGHQAITSYVQAHGLSPFIRAVSTRPPGRPDLMKPHPYILTALSDKAGHPLRGAVFVGDSPSDATAGRVAGLRVIGYANKQGKAQRLQGADAIIYSMHDLDLHGYERSMTDGVDERGPNLSGGAHLSGVRELKNAHDIEDFRDGYQAGAVLPDARFEDEDTVVDPPAPDVDEVLDGVRGVILPDREDL